MLTNKFRPILISLVILIALLMSAGTAGAIPPFPSDYKGTVYVGGVKAGAGLKVTAGIASWNTPEGMEAVTDSSGAYWMAIAPGDSATLDSSTLVGETIHFYVNGVQADETHIFNQDESITGFDLHVAYIPTPTPTSSSSPTPTTEPISSNGASNIGASGGRVATTDGTITITFPAGAFADNTSVSIQGASCQHGATADFVVGSTCFSITPDGYIGALATICVNLSSTDFSIVTNTSDLTLGYWSNGDWNTAVNITRNGTTLCGQTGHLSDWAVLGAASSAAPTPYPSQTATAGTPTATASATAEGTATPTPAATQTPSEADDGGTNWAIIGCIVLGALLVIAVSVIVIRGRGRKKSNKPDRKPQRKPVDKDKDEYW